MTRFLSLLMLILWSQDLVGGIRIVDMRVPAHAPEGGSALLSCHFDMEGDELYSVKWYKGAREFYRYVPNNGIPIHHFQTNGVTVDLSRSSSTVVALTNLKRESAGVYRCEVSGETPRFTTVSEARNINIHYLPKTSPEILGVKEQYVFGDQAAMNCTSAGSRPEAQLRWLLNDKPVSKKHLRGPWLRISQERKDATETVLELRFTVKPSHFKDGVLTIKCQAAIAPLYHEEAFYRIVLDDSIYSTMASPIDENAEESLYFPPIYNEVKQMPLDKYTSDETVDKRSKHETETNQAKLSKGQDLVFIVLLVRFLSFILVT